MIRHTLAKGRWATFNACEHCALQIVSSWTQDSSQVLNIKIYNLQLLGKGTKMPDLQALDDYLSSDDSPDECMMLSDLDGFLHGVACSPVLISEEEWMAVAFGGSPDGVPDWVSQCITLIYNSIIQGLSYDPPEVEPIFWEAKEGHVIAMDWCEGFMEAVSLRPKQWLRLTESGTGGQLITPIMVHLLDESGNSMMGIPQEKLDETLAQAAEEIPKSVVAIYRFW